MSNHALFICMCGVHVPFKHWGEHVKGIKHKQRMARKNKGEASLSIRARKKRKRSKWRD